MTDEQKWLFLESLREYPNASEAARVAGVARTTPYELKKKDPDFAAAWIDAIGTGVDKLEAEAFKRATTGWVASEEFFVDGSTKKRVTKVSDSLVPLLLKAHRPELYSRPEKIEHSGAVEGGASIVIFIPDNGRDPVAE